MVSRDAVHCSYAVLRVCSGVVRDRHSGCQLTDLVEFAAVARTESHLELFELSPRFPTTLRRFRLLTQSGSSNSKLFLRRVLSQGDMTTVPLYPLCAHPRRPAPVERDQNVVSQVEDLADLADLTDSQRSHDELKKREFVWKKSSSPCRSRQSSHGSHAGRPKKENVCTEVGGRGSLRLLMTISAPAL
jgi:hypothetical protein